MLLLQIPAAQAASRSQLHKLPAPRDGGVFFLAQAAA